MTAHEMVVSDGETEGLTVPPEIYEYLVQTGLLRNDAVFEVASLSGGVSNDVLAISATGVDIVVKHALPKLRVEADWFASPDRIVTEAKALEIAGAVLPAHVPPVLAFDAARHLMVIGRAPHSSYEWKSDLLLGIVDERIARQLGGVLAQWHRATANDPALQADFSSTEAFRQLRVDPFYHYVAEQYPDAANAIDDVVGRMLGTHLCLVHGDFSPKNVLIGGGEPWVIDWEVAHLGDPVFDLAFVVSHLVCKALHRPDSERALQQSAIGLIDSYRESVGYALPRFESDYLIRQIACLVLARMDGKSPATYLDVDARGRGREVALTVLASRKPLFDDLWNAS